jgi:hypothetical protein
VQAGPDAVCCHRQCAGLGDQAHPVSDQRLRAQRARVTSGAVQHDPAAMTPTYPPPRDRRRIMAAVSRPPAPRYLADDHACEAEHLAEVSASGNCHQISGRRVTPGWCGQHRREQPRTLPPVIIHNRRLTVTVTVADVMYQSGLLRSRFNVTSMIGP